MSRCVRAFAVSLARSRRVASRRVARAATRPAPAGTEHGDTHEFKFVVGTDWFQKGTDIRQWESDAGGERKITGHLLVEEFDFLVLKRPGYPPYGELADYGPRFKYLDVDGDEEMIEGNGSSTAVRTRLKKTRDLDSVAGLVPAGVLAYIYRHHLYFDDDQPAVFH